MSSDPPSLHPSDPVADSAINRDQAHTPASAAGDDWLSRCGRVLIDRRRRGRLWGCLRMLVRVVGLLLLLGFIALQAALQWVGEHNPTTAFLLYTPPLMWALPLLLWLPVALVFDWRSGLMLALVLAIHPFWHLDYRWRPKPDLAAQPIAAAEQDRTLTLLCWNRGQAQGSLQPFMQRLAPDLILMQEASYRLPGYLRDEAYDFEHGKALGEFMLLSRHPIMAVTPVQTEVPSTDGGSRRVLLAARFEVDFNGRAIAVYNVHFPTHRSILTWHMRGPFLSGVLGLVPGTPFAASRRQHQAYWDRVIDHGRLLAETVEADPLPVIVAGDFNSPHRGVVHRRLTRTLTDAHRAAGHGFGFTLPGSTRNPLSFGGPWMRIDKVLAGDRWRIEGHMTERERGSQHRALGTRLVLEDARE